LRTKRRNWEVGKIFFGYKSYGNLELERSGRRISGILKGTNWQLPYCFTTNKIAKKGDIQKDQNTSENKNI
jgi:hypothetical protein